MGKIGDKIFRGLGKFLSKINAPKMMRGAADTVEVVIRSADELRTLGLGATDDMSAYSIHKAALKGTGLQAHHLNQDAAFKSIIPHDAGLSIGMRGNALNEIDSPHYLFHESLESFWNAYRKGGLLVGTRPTNGQYGQAANDALRAAGYNAAEAAVISQKATAQRIAYGLHETDLVPRVPGKTVQTNR